MIVTSARLFIIGFMLLSIKTYALDTQLSTSKTAFDQRLSTYEYPFPVARYTFTSQGKALEMAYMYLPATKPNYAVVTLLHGKNFNAAYWKNTADFLQSLGYGVLMPDQIGFGKSSKPIDYQYSFEALATHTKNLLEHLDIATSHIVGHSMGGMLASRFALLYPHVTTNLILVNPIGLENYLHYVEYKDVDFFYQNALQQSAKKIVNYQTKNYYDGAWNKTYADLTTPLIGWVQGPDWDTLAQVSARTYDMIFTGPVIEEFDRFRMPVSLILGTRDRTGPGRNWKKTGIEYELGRYDLLGDRVKKRNPDIKVTELDNLGHLPHIEGFTRFKSVFENALKALN
ncbi:alpha/beta fold hydrolase [Aliiglaciecola lipolytica]|uniref:Alpha/beta fold family hydrolase n=1 Tax=Aliiglaciecola lipolytica E3 TaxID=1127673 RepID=K6YY20_9ALTE|nr:alpha/beta fold family hydrolase [Aliiglaciecola lipolytica E3]